MSEKDPQQVAIRVATVFRDILDTTMDGIPILNPAIGVEALGFQEYEGRMLGIVITPWLMSLILFPRAGDDWGELELGDKKWRRIGARQYKFQVNEFPGIGRCQTHSLHSPMRAFADHAAAQAEARSFFAQMHEADAEGVDDPVDEELLGKILRDEQPVDLGEFDQAETAPADILPVRGPPAVETRVASLSRRDLLRGRLRRDATG